MPGPQGNQEGGELSSISEWLGAEHRGQARAAIFKLETAGGGILVTGRLLLVAVVATLKQHKEGEAWNVGSSSGWTAPQSYPVFLYLRPPWYLYLHLSAPSVYLKPGDPRLIGIQKCSLDKWSSHQSSGCHCNGLLQPLLPE